MIYTNINSGLYHEVVDHKTHGSDPIMDFGSRIGALFGVAKVSAHQSLILYFIIIITSFCNQ